MKPIPTKFLYAKLQCLILNALKFYFLHLNVICITFIIKKVKKKKQPLDNNLLVNKEARDKFHIRLLPAS